MTEQPDLFSYTPPPPAPRYPDAPGHRGVDTSIAAADAIAPAMNRLHARILRYLARMGRGCIRDEIIGPCRITTQTACGRLRELEIRGDVVKGSARPGSSGRMCHEYVITSDGLAALHAYPGDSERPRHPPGDRPGDTPGPGDTPVSHETAGAL